MGNDTDRFPTCRGRTTLRRSRMEGGGGGEGGVPGGRVLGAQIMAKILGTGVRQPVKEVGV